MKVRGRVPVGPDHYPHFFGVSSAKQMSNSYQSTLSDNDKQRIGEICFQIVTLTPSSRKAGFPPSPGLALEPLPSSV